jgi:hypothetical protein
MRRGERPYTVLIGYVNTTTQTINVPDFQVQANTLILPESAWLAAEATNDNGTTELLKCRPGAITYNDFQTSRILVPAQSYLREISLTDLFAGTRSVKVYWGIPALGKSNSTYVFPGTNSSGFLESYQNETSLWLKLKLLVMYSPTRETIVGLVVLAIMLWVSHRKKRAVT